MDYGASPPDIFCGRMYARPATGSLLAAAAARDGLSAELQSAASPYGLVVSTLTSGSWLSPSSTAVAAVAAPYAAWMSATAGQADLAATRAQAASLLGPTPLRLPAVLLAGKDPAAEFAWLIYQNRRHDPVSVVGAEPGR